MFWTDVISVYVYKKRIIFVEGLVVFFFYLTCMSAGVHNLHPARCLLPY